MFTKIWNGICAVPRAIGWLINRAWDCVSIPIQWAWENLSGLVSAFHSVFRLERVFWSLLYLVLTVGTYTSYVWCEATINRLDWSLSLAKQELE
jgi:hypothetical protein